MDFVLSLLSAVGHRIQVCNFIAHSKTEGLFQVQKSQTQSLSYKKIDNHSHALSYRHLKVIHISLYKISAHADGGPRSRVCAR